MPSVTANSSQPTAMPSSPDRVQDGIGESVMTITLEQHGSRGDSARWWRRQKRQVARASRIVVEVSNIGRSFNRHTIACLVRFLYSCARQNRKVAICNASPETMVAFEVYGVHHLTSIFGNVASAAAFLSSLQEPLNDD